MLFWRNAWSDVTELLEEIDTLDDQDFFQSFGKGRNGIQTRAQRLISGGHFNIGKIQTAKCRLKSNGNSAIVIRIECVPSVKSEAYWVMFVCDMVTKKFVPAPTSRCGCPAGLGGCSHLRALYAILSVIQSVLHKTQSGPPCSEELTQKEATLMFPPSMQNMTKLPIPWSYAFQDDDADIEIKKLKRQKENKHRQRSVNLNSILTNLNSGQGAPNEEEDSTDGSDDESYSPSDDDSCTDSECELDLQNEGLDDYEER